jgi:hypothetical protein
VKSGTKQSRLLDIAVLERHTRRMDGGDLQRLSRHIVNRRVALGYRNRTDLASSLQLTVRTLADIENGVRKASPRTYAILENKLGWAPGSIDTILSGGEPAEPVPTPHRGIPAAPAQGYALRPTSPSALSQVSTEELLLELRRRVIAPRTRHHDTWDDGLDPHGDWSRGRLAASSGASPIVSDAEQANGWDREAESDPDVNWCMVSGFSGPTYFSDDGHWTILIVKSGEYRLFREQQPVGEFPTLRLAKKAAVEPAAD